MVPGRMKGDYVEMLRVESWVRRERLNAKSENDIDGIKGFMK